MRKKRIKPKRLNQEIYDQPFFFERELSKPIVSGLTMTEMTKWLNSSEMFFKYSSKPFNMQDVENYCRLGHLPFYMGSYAIERIQQRILNKESREIVKVTYSIYKFV
jgi:hypothetical protein